jgi:radical SAM superfamily enzyme YgiQ (UPF0313 family)
LNIVTPPLGIGYLLKAVGKVPGAAPIFLDCHLEGMGERALARRLRELDPVVVGFQVFSIDYLRFARAVRAVRAALPRTCTVAGGPHVTALPELTLDENPDLDLVVCGEGDRALPMLVEAVLAARQHIPNLAYRGEAGCVRTETQFVEDVDEFGAPDWERLKPDRYPPIQHGTFHKSTKVVPILTSRGCPYPCSFCAGHLLTGRRIRRRNIGDVVDEIQLLQRDYGFEEFIIEDENLTFYREHVLRFADEIERRGIRCYFSLPNGVRLDRLDEEVISRLRDIGTYLVVLGVESISPNTLKRMRKNWSRAQVVEVVALLRKHGFTVQANFILGFRDDTMEDIQESVEFALELDIDQAYFCNYIPLPGTEDTRLLLERGELSHASTHWDRYSGFYGKYPYHPLAVSSAELERAVKIATLRFFLRPKILIGFLRRLHHPVFLRSLAYRASHVLSPRIAGAVWRKRGRLGPARAHRHLES